jgi:hypothetical protein
MDKTCTLRRVSAERQTYEAAKNKKCEPGIGEHHKRGKNK